jgi:hypothetical protein
MSDPILCVYAVTLAVAGGIGIAALPWDRQAITEVDGALQALRGYLRSAVGVLRRA